MLGVMHWNKGATMWTSGWGLNTDPLDKAGCDLWNHHLKMCNKLGKGIITLHERSAISPTSMSFPGKVLYKTFFWKHPENAGSKWSAWKSVHVTWRNDIYKRLWTVDLLLSVARFNILRTSQRLAPQEWWLSFVAHRGQVLLRSGPWDIMTTSVAQSLGNPYVYFDSHMYYVMALVFCSGGDAWFDFRDGREACRICLVANNILVLNRSNVWNGTD